MPNNTTNLGLPFLLASQTQKHVTYNDLVNKLDALLMLSVISQSQSSPPQSPIDGDRYIIPNNATGAWQGHSGKIAAFQNLDWNLIEPKQGFTAFIEDENIIYYYNNQWINFSNALGANPSFSNLGIGTKADNINKFSLRANNALFTAQSNLENGDGNFRLKINKSSALNTASLLFQNNSSGLAEIGLIGDNNFGVKTSSDGVNWQIPLKIDSFGNISFTTLNAPNFNNGSNDIIKKADARFFSIPKAANTDGNNYFIGTLAGSLNLAYSSSSVDASYNIGIGTGCMSSLTNGNRNIGIGAATLANNTIGAHNIAIGHASLVANTIGSGNIAFGTSALSSNSSGSRNFAFGASTLNYNTTGTDNFAGGFPAALNNTTGSGNIAIGTSSLQNNTTGNYNVAIGLDALRYKTDGLDNNNYSFCVGLGYNSRVSASNQVQLGGTGTTTYAYGAVQDRSDIRDKADIRDTILGLDFICALRPVDFRWDMRDDYFETIVETDENNLETETKKPIPKDGSKKRNRYHHGLIAQEVEQVLETLNTDFGGFQNHALKGGADVLSLGYTELIAPIIKAIQELDKKILELKNLNLN